MTRTALVFNPGSNSLKAELVEVPAQAIAASDVRSICQVSIDGVGKEATITLQQDEPEPVEAKDMAAAVRVALSRFLKTEKAAFAKVEMAAARVVHGGDRYTAPARFTESVRADIEHFQELAPLHNERALQVLDVLGEEAQSIPRFVAFDTAFHRTLPEHAWRYPIAREAADALGIRKFGFHGLSHRYMLDRMAQLQGSATESLSLVTLHLESGSSACAIQHGRSIDTTMGFTPLEGLMMGSRCGSIDPAIPGFLAAKQSKRMEDVNAFLNHECGLLGIAGGSADTRELAKRDDAEAKLALEMYAYRVRLAVGAYLAALGRVDAVVFGGGIGEDSPWLRERVCEGLAGWGIAIDSERNAGTTRGEVRLSIDGSKCEVWSMPVDESRQIALECVAVMGTA